jgi:hypothetical protein
MYSWQLQQQINTIHDHWHYNRALLTQEQRVHPERFVDHSCTVCYPLQLNLNPSYTAFWQWLTNNSSARTNTQKTFESFNRLLHFNNNLDQNRELHRLLFTIRYRQQEDPNILIPLIDNCLHYTRGFTRNLDQLNLLQNITDTDFDTTDEEENNNNNNFFEDIMAGMNPQNTTQFLNLLQQIANQQSIRNDVPLPTFAGGDQDPLEWVDEFERCAEVNGHNHNSMLYHVRGYLLNEARIWFDEIHADATTRFNSWRNNTRRDFRCGFLNRFCNPGRLLQWRMELNNKLQLPHESVHQYAQSIRKLIKKVDTRANMLETEKVFHFTKGLRREIAAQITSQLTFQPNATLEQVIQAASQIENHGKMYPETLIGFYGQSNNQNQLMQPSQPLMPTNNFLQQTTPPPTNVNDTLTALLQALGNLNLNQNPVQSNTNSNNNNNNQGFRRNNYQGNRPPRNSGVCFKCQQPGHIARNCPQQLPVNNNVNPTQPVVQAFAQQVPIQPMIVQPQVQPQLQPQYPIIQPVSQQPQVIQQLNITPQVHNLPPPQNNGQQTQGNNVFIATQGMQMQQPQQQVYTEQSLNWEAHP